MIKTSKLILSLTVALVTVFCFLVSAHNSYVKTEYELRVQQKKQKRLTTNYVNTLGTVHFKNAKLTTSKNNIYTVHTTVDNEDTTITVNEKPLISSNGDVTLYRASELSSYHITKDLAMQDKTVMRVLNNSGVVSNEVRHVLDYVIAGCMLFVITVFVFGIQNILLELLDKPKRKRL